MPSVKLLCGLSFREAKQGLKVAFVYCRLHIDMERGSVLREVRANHTGQSLNDGAQVFGMHLLQLNRDGDIEQFSFPFLLSLVGEQTAPEHPSQADEGTAFAGGAFVILAAADDLAIEAENRIQERESS